MNSLNYSNYIAITEHFCDLSKYINEMYPPFINDLGLYNNEIFLEDTFYIPKGKKFFPYYLGLLTRDEHGSCHVHIFLKDSKEPFAKINLDKKTISLQEIKSNIEFKHKGDKFEHYGKIEDFLSFLVNTWLDLPYKSNKFHDFHSKYAMEHNMTYFEYFKYKWPFILASNPSSNTDNNDNKKNKKKR